MDAIYKKIGFDSESQLIKNEDSEICKFYSGKTVLITGATGTFGKLVVEKLLRECFNLKKIFLLFRKKERFPLNDRKNEFFKSIVFDKLRAQNPDFEKKIIIIEGDIRNENLNLSYTDQLTIIEETQLIFHIASTEKYETNVSLTLRVNVLGTKHMLDLAKDCKKLEAFIYVSTVFAHAPEKNIKEQFYASPGDLKFVNDLLRAEEETIGLTKDAIASALGDWPNLHLFSRSIAEYLIESCGIHSEFACGIFRSSMLISTYKEPLEGWFDKIDGPAFICLGVGLGCIHTTYMLNSSMDCVPVDMCANALLASTWDLITRENKTKETSVYNYGSSNVRGISLKRFHELVSISSESRPPLKQIWSAFNYTTDKLWLFHILHILFHIIPAFLTCGLKFLRGEINCKNCGNHSVKSTTNKEINMCQLIRKFKMIIHFCNGGWKTHVNEMQKVWDKMNSADRKLFFCDLRDFDWRDYINGYWNGLRLYILNDPISTIEKAKKRAQKLNIIHRVSTLVIGLIFVYWIVIRRCSFGFS